MRRVNSDGTLPVVGEPFGSVNGDVARSASLAVYDGEARVALADETTGAIHVYAYDESDGAFLIEHTIADVAITSESPLLTFAARAADDYRLAYRAADGGFRLLRYSPANGATSDTLPTPTATNTASAILTALELESAAGRVGIVYEIEDGGGSTVEAGLALWEEGVWTATADLSSSSDIEFLDLALDVDGGGASVVVVTPTAIVLNNETATLDLTLAPTLLGSTPLEGAPAALAVSGGTTYLFYVDDDAGAGAIRSTTVPASSWTLESPPTFTIGTGIENLTLVASEDRLFAGYTLAGLGFVRAYQ